MTAESVSGRRLNLDEYFALEEAGQVRHEFVDGVAFAMSGGTPSHSLITANLIGTLHRALAESPCRAFNSDLRIAAFESSLYTYPDVAVVCGDYLTDPRNANTVVNPSLLVEVLSPSTEAWDRGGKFERYRQIPSLQEYVLVSQHCPLVEHYVRQERGWLLRLAVGLDSEWTPDCAGKSISLRDVYAGVRFSEESGRRPTPP